MKNIKPLLVLITLSFFNIVLSGNPCLPDGLEISTQQEIDDFAANYPGCSEIEGRLWIVESTPGEITNLRGLSQLQSVLGNLRIQENISLNSLEGLENLTYVGGDFVLNKCHRLTDLKGLDNLQKVGTSLSISTNDLLLSLHGLEQLDTIGEDLLIGSNDLLTEIIELSQLEHIGGGISIFSSKALNTLKGLENITELAGIYITRNEALTSLEGLNNLIKVRRTVHVRENDLFGSFAGLENLDSIAGNLELKDNRVLNSLAGLNQLKYIGGTFEVNEYFSGFSFDELDRLNYIGGTLHLESTHSINSLQVFENLDSLGGLYLHNLAGLSSLHGLHNVKAVKGNFVIDEMSQISTLTEFESLNYIGGNVEITSTGKLPSLEGFERIDSIRGNLFIERNRDLESFKGLENVKSISGNLSVEGNKRIASFNGLDSLDLINGNLMIESNDSLVSFEGLHLLDTINGSVLIENNFRLNNVNGLDSLKFINVDLEILDNFNLLSLEGFKNLRYIGRSLYIDSNKGLNTLGFSTLDHSNVNFLSIRLNFELSLCNDPFVCNYLSSGGNAGISSNAVGCNQVVEILESCEAFSKVNYQIYYDLNQNKIRDNGEAIYRYARAILEPGGGFQFSNGPDGGLIYLNQGAYNIAYDSLATPDWRLTTDSISYSFTLDTANSCDTFYFGIYPKEEIPEMYPLINAASTRCNTWIPFAVSASNQGTLITDGVLWVEADPAIDSVDFIDPPDTTTNGNRYGWFFNDLLPGDLVQYQIWYKIPGPPAIMVGQELIFSGDVDYFNNGNAFQSETFVYSSEIRCSYDPNDKLVNPARESNETLFDEELIYTIRFQNTGNDLAYDVVIRDTLDDDLDASTFQLLNTSHPKFLLVSLEADRYLTFNFENIFLPDSTADLEGSQGFVSYRILPKDGLPEQTRINNTASIYFDFNPAIVTNTTENILVSELTKVHEIAGMEIEIFPNPTSEVIYIKASQEFKAHVQISDIQGRILRQKNLEGDAQIELHDLNTGIYFLTINVDGQIVSEKIIKR